VSGNTRQQMIEIEFWQYLLLIGGGFIAGCINTLAGYGSIICLTLLMDVIGLPANMANGSNRINVLSTGLIGSYIFHKNGKLNLQKGKIYLFITFLGALTGIYIATIVSNELFRGIFKYLVVILFALLLVKPKRWLNEKSDDYKMPLWLSIPIFLSIGFYGGFIQMGVGLFLLATLVLGAKYNLIEANALKIFITSFYTIIATLIFWWKGLIHWEAGLLLAVGSTLGGWITSNYASTYKNAHIWAYRLLIVMITFIILYQFNAFKWLFG
jgi:uncharacterized membrane protein YfcA